MRSLALKKPSTMILFSLTLSLIQAGCAHSTPHGRCQDVLADWSQRWGAKVEWMKTQFPPTRAIASEIPKRESGSRIPISLPDDLDDSSRWAREQVSQIAAYSEEFPRRASSFTGVILHLTATHTHLEAGRTVAARRSLLNAQAELASIQQAVCP